MSKSYSYRYRDHKQYYYMVQNNEVIPQLVPHFVGCEQCAPGHNFGPSVRDYTIIHYIFSGKGFFEKDGKRYYLSAGDAFVICEGEVTYYEADREDPWHYYWIAFYGELSERWRTLSCPIIKVNSPTIFTEPAERAANDSLTCEFVLSKLFLLYNDVFGKSGETEDYVKQASRYISLNYMGNLSVGRIADIIGLTRSYLSRQFRKTMGISVMQYIVSVRMEKAKELLRSGHTVKQTAKLVGYDDQFAFSKMFKKIYGVSPAEMK